MRYEFDFYFKWLVRILFYMLSEAVVMIATLQSLHINIQEYCDEMNKTLMGSDPLSNPLTAIGLMNIFLILFTGYDIVTEKYIHKDEVIDYLERMKK